MRHRKLTAEERHAYRRVLGLPDDPHVLWPPRRPGLVRRWVARLRNLRRRS